MSQDQTASTAQATAQALSTDTGATTVTIDSIINLLSDDESSLAEASDDSYADDQADDLPAPMPLTLDDALTGAVDDFSDADKFDAIMLLRARVAALEQTVAQQSAAAERNKQGAQQRISELTTQLNAKQSAGQSIEALTEIAIAAARHVRAESSPSKSIHKLAEEHSAEMALMRAEHIEAVEAIMTQHEIDLAAVEETARHKNAVHVKALNATIERLNAVIAARRANDLAAIDAKEEALLRRECAKAAFAAIGPHAVVTTHVAAAAPIVAKPQVTTTTTRTEVVSNAPEPNGARALVSKTAQVQPKPDPYKVYLPTTITSKTTTYTPNSYADAFDAPKPNLFDAPTPINLVECVKQRLLPAGLSTSELREAAEIALKLIPVTDRDIQSEIKRQMAWGTPNGYAETLMYMGVSVAK